MSDEVLVQVENVSKKFCRSLKRALWYGVQDIGSELIGRKYDHELRSEEFWSVRDMSFELRRGQCLGLIGANGAGKSTLLKMLNGLIKPDKGRIIMKGRVAALIELGTGFNPILTGRENIYNNAAVLGFTKTEVNKKLDAIIEFAEISEFINMPVQSYSSGMKVRLGFAVAAQMEPDVLIIDEVLAVGDVGFRMKCFNRIYEIINNAAVILVSHSMPQVSRVSSHLLLMEKGKKTYHSCNVATGIEKYFDLFEGEKVSIAGSGKVKLHEIKVFSKNCIKNEQIPCVKYLEDMYIDLSFSVDRDVQRFSIHFGFIDREGKTVAQCFSRVSDTDFINSEEMIRVKVCIPRVPFAMGIYSINVNFIENTVEDVRGGYLAHYRAVKQFKAVSSKATIQAPIQLCGKWEIID